MNFIVKKVIKLFFLLNCFTGLKAPQDFFCKPLPRLKELLGQELDVLMHLELDIFWQKVQNYFQSSYQQTNPGEFLESEVTQLIILQEFLKILLPFRVYYLIYKDCEKKALEGYLSPGERREIFLTGGVFRSEFNQKREELFSQCLKKIDAHKSKIEKRIKIEQHNRAWLSGDQSTVELIPPSSACGSLEEFLPPKTPKKRVSFFIANQEQDSA